MARHGLAAAGVLAFALGLWWWLHPEGVVVPTHEMVDDRDVGNSLERQSPRSARQKWLFNWADRKSAKEPDSPGPPHIAIQAAAEPGETTPEWGSLSPSDRLTRLEGQFETAVRELELEHDLQAASRAEAALTALRSELYTTPEGRERHAALESRLQASTENE